MLSGKNPRSKDDIGHHRFGRSLAGKPESIDPETFIHHFKRNGYTTVGMGKISHQGDGHTGSGSDRVHELPHSWDDFLVDPDSPWEAGHILPHAYANGASWTKGPAFEGLDVPDTGYRMASWRIWRPTSWKN